MALPHQTRRAALSIPTNIAEGVAKSGPREFRRYLDISLGSASELSYLLLFGRDRGLLSLGEWERLNSKRDRLGQLLWRLYRSIQHRARALNQAHVPHVPHVPQPGGQLNFLPPSRCRCK
jgi:four helix bundle protein